MLSSLLIGANWMIDDEQADKKQIIEYRFTYCHESDVIYRIASEL